MNTIEGQIQSKSLLKIKKIIDNDNNGDKFVIVRTKKNIEFMREYSLNNDDVKDIIRELSVDDCFAGPEKDRNPHMKAGYLNLVLYLKEQNCILRLE